MKKFDKAWKQLCNREGFLYELYLRYVDDCRLFSQALSEGWEWKRGKFRFSWRKWEEDMKEADGDIKRTTREITKAMTDLVSFLDFTGEDSTMFKSGKL